MTNLRLIWNWREVVRKAWSIRLAIISGLLSGLEMVLPKIQEYIETLQIVPTGVLAGAALLVTVASVIARIVAQPRAAL